MVDTTTLTTMLSNLSDITDLQAAGDAWRAIESEADRVKVAAIRTGETPPTKLDKQLLQQIMRKHLMHHYGQGVMTCGSNVTHKEVAEFDIRTEIANLLS